MTEKLTKSSWARLDNFYRKNILPVMEGLRGFTRLGQFTRKKALNAVTEKENGNFRIEVNGVNYTLCTLESAKTLVTEPETLPKFIEIIERDEIKSFVDAGAFHGIYSLIGKGENLEEVYSIEPDPSNFEKLRKNFSLNDFEEENLLNKALMDSSSQVKIESSGDVGNTVGKGEMKVESVPMDQLVESTDLVKMDIEGAEYKALKGMMEVIASSKPILLLEIHKGKTKDPFNHSSEDVINFLEEKGYKIDYLDKRRYQDIVIAQ